MALLGQPLRARSIHGEKQLGESQQLLKASVLGHLLTLGR